MKVAVVIPAFNEEQAIAEVVRAVPKGLVSEILVVDNASTDCTAERAAAAGAKIIREERRGYGAACLAGARAASDADIIVFLDGDRSDDPAELEALAGPIAAGNADLVIGNRLGGSLERGAMPLHCRLGNRLAVLLLRLLYGVDLSDIGSFRAIRSCTLFNLDMTEMTYGWPVEMVVKAARKGLRIQNVPIRYRRRVGVSKVTGTFQGSLRAACRMFFVTLRHLVR